MGSSSYAALKMAAMFVLVLFVGQLLLAEPAAAECTPMEIEYSLDSECGQCVIGCHGHCYKVARHDPDCFDICFEANCEDIVTMRVA
jgi:hypothetical protein